MSCFPPGLTCVCLPLSDLPGRWNRRHIQDPNPPGSTRRRVGKTKSPSFQTNHCHEGPKRLQVTSGSPWCARASVACRRSVDRQNHDFRVSGSGCWVRTCVVQTANCCCWGEEWESFLPDFQQLNGSSGSLSLPLSLFSLSLRVWQHAPSLTPSTRTHTHPICLISFSVSL